METEKQDAIKPKQTSTRVPKPVVADASAWGKREYGIIAKSFDGETHEVKGAIIAISGMLQVVKLNLSEQPVVIIYLLKKHFSHRSEVAILDDLRLGLKSMFAGFDSETLPDLLTNVKTNLVDEITDTQWNNFWNIMFLSIAAPLLPWEKICSYAPYVYNVLVKPVVK